MIFVLSISYDEGACHLELTITLIPNLSLWSAYLRRRDPRLCRGAYERAGSVEPSWRN